MWRIGIGPIEVVLFLLLVPPVVFSRGVARRWLGAVLAITAVSIVLTPSDPVSAVIVAVPPSPPVPVTKPFPSTVATVTFELDHATFRPDSMLPDASLSVAVSCTVSKALSVLLEGETSTDATGAG